MHEEMKMLKQVGYWLLVTLACNAAGGAVVLLREWLRFALT